MILFLVCEDVLIKILSVVSESGTDFPASESLETAKNESCNIS